MPKKSARKPRSKPGEIPNLLSCKIKGVEYAFILLGGKRRYLGKFGTVEAEEARIRAWLEWKAAQNLGTDSVSPTSITVAILVDRFLAWAESVYTKHGRTTGTYERFCIIVRPLLQLYAATPVAEFGPLCLKAVREVMIETGICRRIINDRITGIRQIFKWGVENELVRPETWQALTAVAGLKAGRTTAPDRPDVLPVADSVVDRTIPYLPSAVADMVRIQRLTGMRPGETISLRPVDIFREGDEFPPDYEFNRLDGVWIYIPEEHKTEHHKRLRFVVFGPRAQAILTPYLAEREREEYVFSPKKETVRPFPPCRV